MLVVPQELMKIGRWLVWRKTVVFSWLPRKIVLILGMIKEIRHYHLGTKPQNYKFERSPIFFIIRLQIKARCNIY